MKQCFGYARVSTIKQGEGVSLDAQREAIQVFAERHNIEIVKWFEEKETAAKKGRPIFTAMLKQLRQGQARGLVMHKIDRSARNFADWAKIGELADSGIDIHFATETLDFHSRGGRLTADIQAVIAADYIRNLREETIKGINGRLKQGLFPFRAPIGYLDQGGGMPKIPDPTKAPLIKQIFQRYATGECSINSLRADMLREGLTNLHDGTVSAHGIETILNNPFYCGIIRIKRTGQSYTGIHEPLIPARLFSLVQDVKTGRHVGKKVTRHNHTFRGLFKCVHCQTAAIAERQKGHVYYRCHTSGCATKSVREEAIDSAVVEALRSARITTEQAARFTERLTAWLKGRRTAPETGTLHARKKLVEDRLERLTDVLLDGDIDSETYNTKKQSLILEQAELSEKISSAKIGPTDNTIQKFVELMKSLYLTYQIAEPDEKRQIAKLTTSNRLVSGRNAHVQPQNWLMQASTLMTASFGEPDKGSSRTGRDVTDGHIDVFLALLQLEEVEKLTNIVSTD